MDIKKILNQFVVRSGLAISNCNFPKTRVCNNLPDDLEQDTIYIIGYRNYIYSVAFICPCGSGHIVHLSLHKDEHPYWSVSFHINGTVSLSPSIWYKQGCLSHFFIKHGKVIPALSLFDFS